VREARVLGVSSHQGETRTEGQIQELRKKKQFQAVGTKRQNLNLPARSHLNLPNGEEEEERGRSFWKLGFFQPG